MALAEARTAETAEPGPTPCAPMGGSPELLPTSPSVVPSPAGPVCAVLEAKSTCPPGHGQSRSVALAPSRMGRVPLCSPYGGLMPPQGDSAPGQSGSHLVGAEGGLHDGRSSAAPVDGPPDPLREQRPQRIRKVGL